MHVYSLCARQASRHEERCQQVWGSCHDNRHNIFILEADLHVEFLHRKFLSIELEILGLALVLVFRILDSQILDSGLSR